MSLLIVASETSSPLCTDTSIPTDGQPHHYACDRCETRVLIDDVNCTACQSDQIRPAGPFPFTAGRWAKCLCGPLDGAPVSCGGGAIVELVEVVGPSHHAGECHRLNGAYHYGGVLHECDRNAPSTGWHTPTGQVTPLAEPIPCERPTSYHDVASDVTVADESPTWWTAPQHIAAKLGEDGR